MTRKWLYVSLTAFFTAFVLLSPLNSPHAYAATTDYAPTCSNTDMGNWDWPDQLNYTGTGSDTGNGGGLTGFDASKSSYIIMHETANSGRNVFDLFTSDNTTAKLNLQLETISSVVHPTIRTQAGNLKGITIISENDGAKAWHDVWGSTGDLSAFSPAPPKWSNVYGPTTQTQPLQINTAGYDCVYAAHNVNYDPTWLATYNTLSSAVSWAPNTGGASCSALAIGCWITKAIDGVDNAFISLFTSAGHFIANLFIPNGSDIATSWSGFNTFMSGKLGFLTYPFTFVVDLFDAFTTSTTGCTTSSCSIDFGNFYGHDFSINYLAAKSISSDLLSYIRLVIQSLTVLALVFAIHRKYIEVVKS